MDIEFFDPKEIDFHGIRELTQRMLGTAYFDASPLASAIIETVGYSDTKDCCCVTRTVRPGADAT